ncbi:MAG: hypothetical protein D6689_17625 [Deltaproteobacteria bacterium]|nr:MAG: hypothetical protein D6689_17625 [Deltaproteobacteria bacterium]
MTIRIVATAFVFACSAACDRRDADGHRPASQRAAAPADAAVAPEPVSVAPQPVVPAPPRDRVQAFCEANYRRLIECIDDKAFWNVMATLYFQTDPQLAANPAAKEPWIEMMRDAALTLHREGELANNCRATLDHNKWPTEEQMRRVDAARAQSCAAFGNAYGYMMFGEGVFFEVTSPVDDADAPQAD